MDVFFHNIRSIFGCLAICRRYYLIDIIFFVAFNISIVFFPLNKDYSFNHDIKTFESIHCLWFLYLLYFLIYNESDNSQYYTVGYMAKVHTLFKNEKEFQSKADYRDKFRAQKMLQNRRLESARKLWHIRTIVSSDFKIILYY